MRPGLCWLGVLITLPVGGGYIFTLAHGFATNSYAIAEIDFACTF